MSDELDNPIVEPSDKFYGVESDKTEVPEVAAAVVEEAPEETVVVKSEELEVTASDAEDDAGSLVYEIGEEEVTQKQILEWKQGYLRQSDYTQKTQGVAEKVKTEVSSKVSEVTGDLDARAKSLDEHTTALATLLDEIEGGVDLEELRELDYEEYQKTKETIDGRRTKLTEAKAAVKKATDEAFLVRAQQEQVKLHEANPDWTDDQGQSTAKKEDDYKLINDYLKESGWTGDEFNQVVNANHMQAILDAAKYRQLKKKTTESKKVKVAPKLVKPTQKSTKTDDTRSAGDRFYAKG
jgi:hypothetical protein